MVATLPFPDQPLVCPGTASGNHDWCIVRWWPIIVSRLQSLYDTNVEPWHGCRDGRPAQAVGIAPSREPRRATC